MNRQSVTNIMVASLSKKARIFDDLEFKTYDLKWQDGVLLL